MGTYYTFATAIIAITVITIIIIMRNKKLVGIY